jgi:glyoxylase-like metal-dependent hydrolase (beta-lactamase superfamily II)
MLIKTLPVGDLETNCYIVTNEQTLESVVIDPGDESNTILDYLEDNRLTCKAIFLTHGHYDHVGAVSALQEETGAPVYMNAKDDAKNMHSFHFPFSLPENGKNYDDGDVVEAAGLTFHILATPGHTPGSVVIRVEDALFTGDTLFAGGVGRTDLPGGNMATLIGSITGRLLTLPGDTCVLSGHGPETTIGREAAANPYLFGHH